MSMALKYQMMKKKKKDAHDNDDHKYEKSIEDSNATDNFVHKTYGERDGRPVTVKFGAIKKMAEGGDMVSETSRPVVPGDKRVADSFRKAFNGAKEDPCDAHGEAMCQMCHGGKMAEGGFVEDEMASGFEPNPKEHSDHMYGHSVENQDPEGEEMIHMIMQKRKMMSKGGMVANDTGEGANADELPNQFDDLVLDDHLEQHDTGANSGDELGDHQEDEDRRDIVSQIMKSRKKKDRLPHPM